MSEEAAALTMLVESATADNVQGGDSSARDAVADPVAAQRLIESELLVEDVSIDGMCGVY